LAEHPASRPTDLLNPGFNYRSWARTALAGVFWLEGSFRRARAVAQQSIEEALKFDHHVTQWIVLVWATNIFLWDGDLSAVEQYADRLIAQADRYSLPIYRAVGRGMKGELLIRRGQPDLGVAQLLGALEALHGFRYEIVTSSFMTAVAKGYALAGHFEDAIRAVNDAIAVVERNGDLFAMPELFRAKGWVLMSSSDALRSEAEDYFLRSLDLAARQGALAWELRTATSLARLQAKRGERNRARNTLAQVFDRFTGNFDNADLAAARSLLDDLA
jgi:tetratricopeptide (TPR) repeat protein